jgi:hypothetical protein
MKPALIMTLVCAATAGALGINTGYPTEMFAGMVAPLVAAVAIWLAVERAYRLDPGLVMRVLLMTWVAEVLFFASYLVLMLKGAELRPEPFVISFTLYFIALHAADALLMRRLFLGSATGGGAL